MDFSKLRRGEIIAAVGGVILAIAVFLPAFSPNEANPFARVAGGRDDASLWETHRIMSILLLASAIAPIVLLWVIIRQHTLSWPAGELTAVIGLVSSTLLFYVGIIDRP